MNSELLTREGVFIFIMLPVISLMIGAWRMTMQEKSPFAFFTFAMAMFLLGFTFGGETNSYRFRAQKIFDQNFSLFYSDDLQYQVDTPDKRWDNMSGDILVTKYRNAWGAEINQSVTVVPSIEK